MSKKIKMRIEMDVTVPQALALQALFGYMNYLSNIGSSRDVGFFADGDGNFHPHCEITFDGEIPELTKELQELAVKSDHGGDRVYDFDAIAWKINHQGDEN